MALFLHAFLSGLPMLSLKPSEAHPPSLSLSYYYYYYYYHYLLLVIINIVVEYMY